MRTKQTPSRWNIAVVAAFRLGVNREIGRAVMQYAIDRGDWTVILVDAGELHFLRQFNRIHGIIASCSTPEVIAAIRKWRCPVVNVSGRYKLKTPTVTFDGEPIGRMAAEHLLERGLRSFLAMGSDSHFSQYRTGGFVDRIRQAGFDCPLELGGEMAAAKRAAEAPKPLGVFAITDHLARSLMVAGASVGLHIGHDVALVGVDNDDLICESVRPRLTSVDPRPREVGRQAAGLLNDLMIGKPAPRSPILVQPLQVIVRQSSDFFAYDDAVMGRALRIIADEACDALRVDHIADKLCVSRRWLEKRFKQLRGVTVYDEIRHARYRRACELLAYTDLSVGEVARRIGIRDPKRFSTQFHQRVGVSPSAYRGRLAGVKPAAGSHPASATAHRGRTPGRRPMPWW